MPRFTDPRKNPDDHKRYDHNIKLLKWFAPFSVLPFSGAYITPFLLHNQISQTEIFILQSIATLTFIIWNLPSGYIADRFGRSKAIWIGALISGLAMILYGIGDSFLVFAIGEIGLAVGDGLINGADRALLIDSLKKMNRDDEYVKLSQRMNSRGWTVAALGVPISIWLVSRIGLGATLVADGCLLIAGMFVALHLRDAEETEEEAARNLEGNSKYFREDMKKLLYDREPRYLLILTTVLKASPYLSFWMIGLYYKSIGLPLYLYSLLFAVRSLWKAYSSNAFHGPRDIIRSGYSFSLANLATFISMSTSQLALVWTLLAHDTAEALSQEPIVKKLNTYFSSRHRAMLNSTIGVAQRIVFIILGPLVGLVIDRFGFSIGCLVAGSSITLIAWFTLAKLRAMGNEKSSKTI